MDANQDLLREIRDLLREQNRLVAELKAQNEAAMERNAAHMAKAEEAHQRSLAQNTAALSHTGWLKWGFWVFLFALLLVFILPNFWR
jgi:hypothetical protein